MTLPENFDPKIDDALRPFMTADDAVLGVAVSGGGDSMALLLAMNSFIQKFNLPTKLIALTVDHKLRADAAIEAAQVAKWCLGLNIEHHILDWQFEEMPQTAIQQKARDARYGLMGEFCAKQNIDKLFVAHNLEDNAETFLMRLKRGAGLKGLSSIVEQSERIVNDGAKIQIIRPFLNLKRAELRSFLKQHEQAWIDDVSNEDVKFERVQVRKFLNQSELLDSDDVAQSAMRLAQANAAIEHYLEAFWQTEVKLLEFGIAKVEFDEFNDLPDELKLRLLARLVWTIGGQVNPPRWQKIETLLQQIESAERQFCLGNCLIVKKQNNLWFGFENREGDADVKSVIPKQAILWQNRLWIRNTGVETLQITCFSAWTAHSQNLLQMYKQVETCPKVIVKNMMLILGADNQLLWPSIDEKMSIDVNLKIHR